jgi:hypothetical protein
MENRHMGDPDTSLRGTGLAGRLRWTVTLSLPGWAVAAGVIALVLIVIVVLD